MHKTIPATVCFLLMTASAALGAQTYPIRLSVPEQVGDVVTVSIKAGFKFSTHWTAPGSTTRPTETAFKAELDATDTVEAVDDKGRPSKLSVKVARCTKDGAEVLPAGTVIMAESVDGETRHTIDGAAPTADVEEVLKELVYFSRPEYPAFDDLFGSKEPRKVGESWPADQAMVAKATHLPYPLKSNDSKGGAKLEQVSVVDGREVETILINSTGSFDSRKGSDGQTYTDLKMNFDLTMTRPVAADPKAPLTDRFTRSVSYTMTGPRGSQAVFLQRTRDAVYTNCSK